MESPIKSGLTRRQAVKNISAGIALLATGPIFALNQNQFKMDVNLKGNINHSVCQWCYSKYTLEELCMTAEQLGITSIDLIAEDGWPILKKYGLTCAMAYAKDGSDLSNGFNNPANHEKLIKGYEYSIPKAAAAGIKNLICFSGNRNGLNNTEGLKNCATALKKLMPLAAKHGITLVMELLNSKVDHPDYQCDHTLWGVELCKLIDSPNFKLLYDIYHMQIMEGDIIRTLKENIKYIAHFHTGGNPGRNEIDETQELYYPAIMKAIVETGFKGFVAQEFIPKGEPFVSLKKAIQICDV